ncbi:helix-turn-helix domain-containing protein [Caulobacter endophyticus]|uniref:AraC-like ligand-binding domain-containing protein n=1 Tax=Caulobacter endophyticus TaxID=2172652 RepID=UPI00240F0C4F|nr:helix-turn-helix domain-containing protein [Caulobacter endophyticus]MDG2528488.1 helix-turn-helix domain-containing protein [Caulobacter endophyticus]
MPAAATAESFRFSSNDHPADEAFALYAALYSRGSDVSRGAGPFFAQVRGWRLDKVLLFERRLSGVVHARRERIAGDGFDHFVLTHVLEGQVRLAIPGPPRLLEPGAGVLLDTRRPMRTEHENALILTASIARDVIEAALGPAGRLHGQVLTAPDNLVLADFLASLARRGDSLAPTALPALGRAFVDVLASAGGDAARVGREDQRRDLARREAVRRFVVPRLADRALSVEAIAVGAGISRSSLYRLFEKQGGVARFIQLVRLDALRRALDAQDPAAPDEAALAERLGFAGPAQMARLFAEAYGAAPAAYRAALDDKPHDDPGVAKQRWDGWLRELD